MKPAIGAKSDVGRVRDGNEDSYLVQEPLFVVADGMGGHLAGDVASRIAVQTISERANDGATQTPEALEQAVKEANAAIYEKANSDPALHGMGTTCTLVLVAESDIHIAHVGDSRAYLLRGGELSQLTEDHTLVGRMVREGRLQPEEAERHPQRSIITRALGVDDDVDVDVLTIPIEDGDTVLICSDGLSSMLDSGSIRRVLAENDDPQAAVDELIERANEAGGEDNITAVVLAFDGGGGAVAAAATRADVADPPAASETTTTTKKTRPVLVTLVLVGLVLAAGVAAFKYLIVDNSFFVAPNDTGRLAIYRGLPEQVLGMTFQEEVQTSTVTVDELPAFLTEDVEDAIETDSLEEARTTLANLEQRARDEEFQRGRDTGGDNR